MAVHDEVDWQCGTSNHYWVIDLLVDEQELHTGVSRHLAHLKELDAEHNCLDSLY